MINYFFCNRKATISSKSAEPMLLRLVEVAKKYGMTGIGVKQNGPPGKRFLHLDNLGSDYYKLTGGPRSW